MVIVMKPNARQCEIHRIIEKVKSLGCRIHVSQGENYCLLGLVGHTEKIDLSQLQANEHVDRVIRVQHPFKLVNRLFHPEDTVLDIEGVKVGGGNNVYIAGPCAVESEEQLLTIATAVKEAGAHMLRGGAYKPRTSPYSFQGLEEEGLKIMERVKFETGLPIVTEVMSPDTVEIVASYADVLQIGGRNMQSFPLLMAVGETDKPVLLKRGLSATIEEWLMAAEYIMAEGNKKVILCERGIRTFETYTRNTLDLSAVPAVKELSHLPIIVDPSHAAGKWRMVEPLSKAAIAVGADGLIVEVHHQPELAVSDGAQSLKPEKFEKLMKAVRQIAAINEVTRC